MLQREKGERKFQKQMLVVERKGKHKGMLQREKGERKFQKQWQVAESKGKEIKACCRGRREKGSFRNKGRSLRGKGKR
jgi:hypothetical protein